MCAALRFARELAADGVLDRVARLQCRLYSSLALTGRSHATDTAVLLGLSGGEPETVDLAGLDDIGGAVRSRRELHLLGRHRIAFHEPDDLLFLRDESLPLHPNGMRLTALNADGGVLAEAAYYSVGGGFVVSAAEAAPGVTGGTPPTCRSTASSRPRARPASACRRSSRRPPSAGSRST